MLQAGIVNILRQLYSDDFLQSSGLQSAHTYGLFFLFNTYDLNLPFHLPSLWFSFHLFVLFVFIRLFPNS